MAKVIVLDMTDVPMIDITGIIALRELVKTLQKDGIVVIFANLVDRIMLKLQRAGLKSEPGHLLYCRNLDEVRSAVFTPVNSG